MPVEVNALETARFGVICARLSGANTPLEAANIAAQAQEIRMISTRVDVACLDRVHALEADGYRLMDTLVYYSRTLEHALTSDLTLNRPAEGLVFRSATPDDAALVGGVATEAFAGYIGHYHADPRLESRAADAAYIEWAQNSILSISETTPALVAQLGDRIVGFLTLRYNTDTQAEIVLNGVHPDHQRSRAYTGLVTHAITELATWGLTEVIVSTQINNYAVQKVWSRLGMAHTTSYYTFHKWFD